MRRALCTLALVAVTARASAQVTRADVEAHQNATGPTNAHLSCALASEAKQELGVSEFGAVVRAANAPNTNALNGIARRTVEAQQRHDVGLAILKGNNALIKGSIAAGTSLGGMPILGAIINQGVSASLDAVTNVYEEEGRNAIRRNLKTSLERFRAQNSPQATADLLASPDPATFRLRLEQNVGNVFGSDLDNLPAEQQDIVNSFYNRELADLFQAGFATISQFQTLQAGEIEQNRKDIKGLALAFTEYAEETNRQLGEIAETQRELSDGLQNLNARLGQTEQGVAFLQDMMFSKLSPAEQLTALRNGIFPNMPEAQRKDLEEKLAVVAKRQELVNEVGRYLNGASDLTNIARNLGVDPNIVAKAEQAVAVGQHAVAAFSAFASGNYLAAISSVSNILGVGGPDVAGERHREIMEAFGQMFNKLNVIEAKVDELLRGQQLILQTQAAILQNIERLAEQVQQSHDDLAKRLHELHNDVLYNRQLVARAASQHYADCFDVIHDVSDGTIYIDTASGVLPTRSRFAEILRDKRPQLIDCMRQLSLPRDGNNDFSAAVFALETYRDTVDGSIGPFLENVYRPALAILTSTLLVADNKTVAQRVTSLFAPMQTAAALDAKLASVTAQNPPRFRKPAVAELMTMALAVPAVVRHTADVANVHYYALLLDGQDQPRTVQELYRADNLRMSGRNDLLEALSLTDTAIAQQTMLGGDAMLPLLIEVLSRFGASTNAAEKALHDSALRVLQNNSVLARNLVLYAVRKHVQSESNFATYAIAVAGSDITSVKAVAGTLFELQRGDEGWSAVIGTTRVALPSAEALVEGRFAEADDVRVLAATRARLLAELSGYDVYLTASANVRRNVNDLLLRRSLSQQ